MAQSPSHKLGQMIGDQVEAAIQPRLETIAKEFGLYPDHQSRRPARGGKTKVSWTDLYGNTHDLDYVLEADGTPQAFGKPKAFIETAWRRYTKHSRNKAQEIQGAIAPLAARFADRKPFLGVVLAGEFTNPSLDQLRSHGFAVAYCPYSSIVQAFDKVGVDVSSEEDSSGQELDRKVKALESLSKAKLAKVQREILRSNSREFSAFFGSLRESLMRRVQQILIWPLFGASHSFGSISDAMEFVHNNDQQTETSEFVRYEILISFSNKDEIRGAFGEKAGALEFLRSFGT